MIIFPKLTSVTRVPLVEPKNSYYMVILRFFDKWQEKEKKEEDEKDAAGKNANNFQNFTVQNLNERQKMMDMSCIWKE